MNQTPGNSKEVGTPRYLSLVVPLRKVGDEAVHKELGDRMERAATTASSSEAEQDSGSGPRCQDTILGDVDAQTRFETTSKQSNDPPLSKVNTFGSGEDNMKILELMAIVLDLEKAKSDQAIEIASLKKRHNEDLMIDTGLLDDDVLFVGASSEKNEQSTKLDDSIAGEVPAAKINELTLAQTLIEIKVAKPKVVTTAATTTTIQDPMVKGFGSSTGATRNAKKRRHNTETKDEREDKASDEVQRWSVKMIRRVIEALIRNVESTVDITELLRKLKFICRWANLFKDFERSNVPRVKLSLFSESERLLTSLQALLNLHYLFSGFMDYFWSCYLSAILIWEKCMKGTSTRSRLLPVTGPLFLQFLGQMFQLVTMYYTYSAVLIDAE
ncbi:hypothetical protein Tco_1133873 [Tanacetum coccineum]